MDDSYELSWECDICNEPLSTEGYLCNECAEEEGFE